MAAMRAGPFRSDRIDLGASVGWRNRQLSCRHFEE